MRPDTNSRYRRANSGLIALGVTCTVVAASPSRAHAEEPVFPVVVPLTEPVVGAPAARPKSRSRTTLSLDRPDLKMFDGQSAEIAGILKPRLARRLVTLQIKRGHGWLTLAHTITGFRGRFTIRYRPERVGSERVRVRFAGDGTDRPAARYPGRLTVYRAAARSSSTRLFVRCVTMHESSMQWHIVDPPYSGGDQWTESTWLAAGGGRFASIAAQATPEQQMRVFEDYEPAHPGAWPVTVPACS
jgi:hypothetical protein